MTLRNKLIKNFGANAYGQIVTTLIQLVSVPLYLKYWGVHIYGEWLILSSIPAYLALSDIGFASVAANDMTMKMAAKDLKGALCSYQSVWVLITLISFVFCVVCLITIELYSTVDLLNIKYINEEDVKIVLSFLVVYTLLGLQVNIVSSVFRAVGQYAVGAFAGNTARLAEWLVALLMLINGGGIVSVVITMFVIKSVSCFAMFLYARKIEKNLNIGIKYASLKEIGRLWKSAVAFMSFPLGLALGLQGTVLVIGATIGATAVVVYSTYRTLTRLLVQCVTLINQSVWPELSRAYGQKNIKLVIQIFRKVSSVCISVGLVAVGVLSVIGGGIIQIWTNHHFESNQTLLAVMLLGAFINICWQPSWVVLMAINRHSVISIYFVVETLVGLILSYFIASYFGIIGIATVLTLLEVPMAYLAIDKVLGVLNDSWTVYIKKTCGFSMFVSD
jgi:O-antigen/teichoic acid export membrane protein